MSEKQYDYSKRDVDSRSKSFRIDVNNPQEGQSGPEAYKIIGETDDGVKVSQSLSQTGLFRITSEGTMEIVGGSKNKPKGLDIRILCTKGDIAIQADSGFLRLYGNNIILDTPGTLTLGGSKIKIGNSMTSGVTIQGSEVQVETQETNIKLKSGFGIADFFKGLLGLDI